MRDSQCYRIGVGSPGSRPNPVPLRTVELEQIVEIVGGRGLVVRTTVNKDGSVAGERMRGVSESIIIIIKQFESNNTPDNGAPSAKPVGRGESSERPVLGSYTILTRRSEQQSPRVRCYQFRKGDSA